MTTSRRSFLAATLAGAGVPATPLLAEAALSYLGLGTQPPTPSWGRMLSEAQNYLSVSPLLALWPGICIALTVLALFLIWGCRAS